MITRETKVGIGSGLEARPIAVLVQIATRFKCSIRIEYNGRSIDPRSLMGAMNLAAPYGSAMTVICDGAGEEEAADAICDYISGR